MDSETVYSLVGFLIFGVIAYFTLRKSDRVEIQTKEEKRYEILKKYREELRKELESVTTPEAKKAKKVELLKRFSEELSQNIFFEQVEIKELILDIIDEY